MKENYVHYLSGVYDSNGNFTADNPDDVSITRNLFAGKRVVICIVQQSARPTEKQKHWYWFCCSMIADHTGEDIKRVHEINKMRLLSDPDNPLNIKSTSDLRTKKQWMKFIDDMMKMWEEFLDDFKFPEPE